MTTCRESVGKAMGDKLSGEELDGIFSDLNNVEGDMMEAGRVIAEDAKIAGMIERRNAYLNVIRENEVWRMIEDADKMTGDPSLGIEAALVGVNSPFKNSSRSVDALSQGYMSEFMGGVIHDLKQAGLHRQFSVMKGDFSRDVARALHDLNGGKSMPNVTKDAQGIARVMHKYQKAALRRENRAGAYIRERKGYVVAQSHAPERMVKVGFDRWAADIRKRIDWEKMGVEDQDAYLKSAYDAITSGVRLDPQRTDIARAFKGPGNLAKKESASRTIEFKSADDWFEYDQAYGRADLRESFLRDMESSLRATALMERLGTNPKAMLERLQARAAETYRGDAKKLKRIRREGVNALSLEAALDEVTGDINIGAHTTVARVNASFRHLQTMAKLGGATISAMTDIAFNASNQMFHGKTMLQSWHDAFMSPMEGMSKGQKREFSDLLGAGLEGQMGDFLSRVNAADHVAGRTSKLMSTFFKLNLLGPWTDANKRGVTMILSRDLAMNAERAFADLPDDMRRILETYGFNAKQWEVARLAVREADDGRKYLMPGDVDKVRGAAFTGLSESQQTRLRDQVRSNLFTFLSGEADRSVPTPGARERAMIRRGYRPGSVAGEAIRHAMLFKSFGFTMLSKVMGRHVYGTGAKTLREQIGKGWGANTGLVNAIVMSTVLGYFVMQAKEIMKGREPRPLNPDTFIAAMMQGGGLGIYGDFLFGEANRFGGGPLETLAGPSVTTVFDALELMQRARGVVTGGDEDLRGDALRLVKSNVPFANLFYVKGAMDYLIWYQLQEMINPGYLGRMERRVERENNQQYWLPPSRVVERGGGFR